jgi:hypothetical protein
MLIHIIGQWNDSHESFVRKASVDPRADPHHKSHQQWIWDCDSKEDESIFYYFESWDHILGNHGDFTVTDFKILVDA